MGYYFLQLEAPAFLNPRPRKQCGLGSEADKGQECPYENTFPWDMVCSSSCPCWWRFACECGVVSECVVCNRDRAKIGEK